MKLVATSWLGTACMAWLAALAACADNREVKVTGTGNCADITYSGERGHGSRDPTFQIVSITNRACRAGEASGSRTYTPVNPRGGVAGGRN